MGHIVYLNLFYSFKMTLSTAPGSSAATCAFMRAL